MMDDAAPGNNEHMDRNMNDNNNDINNNTNSIQMVAGEDRNAIFLSLSTTLKDKKLIEDIMNHAPTPTQPNDIQEYWDYCSHCTHCNSNDENNKKPKMKMEILLCQSCNLLAQYLNNKFIKQQGIPYYMFNDAKGVVFLSYWKAGLVIGAAYGTGILLTKWEDKWSGPCAVSLGSCEIGLDIGIEKVDYILVINDASVLRFFENHGILKIGGDVSIALGPYGKDVNMITTSTDSIFAYSFAKGGYIGIGLESGILSIAKNWNEEYYGKPIAVEEIIYNKIEIPQNEYYSSLIHVINQYNLKSDSINNISMDHIVIDKNIK